MKNILIIGIGGTGSNAAVVLDEKIKEFGKTADVHVSTIVFDTDVGDLKNLDTPYKVSMSDNASVGTICDRIGKKYIREWFPCDDKAVRNQEMFRGASQWRKKSYLAFLNVMNQPMKRKTLTDALENMMADPSGSCEVYVLCSLAGGTGSGSVIPLTLYVKRYLRRVLGVNPVVRGMFALPGIFAPKQTDENAIKVYANAYGVLREINGINLVTRDYNNGHQVKKNTPVRYKLGNEAEPNVGVLFDSQNPEFWTPQAAPFDQIFVLDKVVGIDDPKTHDIILANSLYSIICTDIGKEIDSEASNHEILHSQNNGSNAIFSSISSSQIRFPKDSILNYLAYRKTEESCKDEWLAIHNEVEKEIKRIEKENRENGQKKPFTTKDYAKLYEKEYQNIAAKGRSPIVELVDRSVYLVNESGTKTDLEEKYNKKIRAKIANLIDDKREEYLGQLILSSINKKEREKVKSHYNTYRSNIESAYDDLVELIKSNINLYSEQVFSLEFKKFPAQAELTKELANEYGLVNDLLQKNGKYIHPVAAMLQLCKLKKHIGNKEDNLGQVWNDLSRDGKINYKDEELFNLTGASTQQEVQNKKFKSHNQFRASESYYASEVSRENGNHFENMDGQFKKDSEYYSSGSNAQADDYYLRKDAEALMNKLFDNAVDQMTYIIMARLAECVDVLIKNYRSFFSRFEKEKENLTELTKNAKKRDAVNKGAVINVYSSVEDKEKIEKKVFNLAGPESDEEIALRDDVVGSSVFETIYKKSVAETSEGLVQFNDKDAKPYTALFDSMVESYKEVIKKSDGYAEIDSYNVIQAIQQTADSPDEQKAALKERFTNANSLAKPAVRLNEDGDNEDSVQYSKIAVFMMSKETANYIKRHAEELGIKIADDESDEKSLVISCAKEFINQYSKEPKARTVIVDNIPDYIIYCTGEIMDIAPLRIPQFDELSTGEDGKYFSNYCEALKRAKKYDTDMWNPHLGNDLDKQCNLPYINTELGRIKDEALVKALISLLNEGKLRYGKLNGVGEQSGFIYSDVNGIEKKVYSRNADGVVSMVNKENIAELMNWMRNLDESTINHYAKILDERIRAEKQKLPTVINEADAVKLIGTIDTINVRTVTDENKTFMLLLCKKLFDIDGADYSIIDFAFAIKNSEENSSDYDDAERILTTANKIFEEIVSYRTNPKDNPQLYIRTAHKAYSHIYKWIATKAIMALTNLTDYDDANSQYTRITTWMNASGAFRIRKEEAYLEGNMDSYTDCKFKEACKDVAQEVINDSLEKASQRQKDVAAQYGCVYRSKQEQKEEQ